MEEFEQFFKNLQKDQYFPRFGKVFQTDDYYYFLDMGTGKIAQVNKDVYLVLKALFETNNDFQSLGALSLTDQILKKALAKIRLGVEKQHILSAPLFSEVKGKATLSLDSMLESEVAHIILEVTEKCNLRCKYCIYHPTHLLHRRFGTKDMSVFTAKCAIDFLASHSQKNQEVYIGFYGGEPLLNFPLIKFSIQYAKSIFKNKKVSFSRMERFKDSKI
ncbi:MAG: 4Fe-4S cluster-binding domain-containing protein [Streptococcaceae bacterium]|nr:4Fe-4S cluster-binding domain-containing protein [Streptococcaceae bacterium]